MPSTGKQKLLVIVGPTASGKTTLAIQLARRFRGEIWSADSRQVYRGLNIGSGKDLNEFQNNGPVVPYHLIDVVDPQSEFSVFDFQKKFYADMEDLALRSDDILPILVGGTGLYLEAGINGERLAEVPVNLETRRQFAGYSQEMLVAELRRLNPKLHNHTDLVDRERLLRAIEIAMHRTTHVPEPGPALNTFILGIAWDRVQLRQRIRERLRTRLDSGLIEEVAMLHRQGVTWERLDRFGLEYRYVARYLQTPLPHREQLFEELFLAIADFAKRQMTWYRRMERQGYEIHWVPGNDFSNVESLVRAWYRI